MDAQRITEHVVAIASRSRADSAGLTSALIRNSWPAGVDDRREPAAIEWLSRWRPLRTTVAVMECACSTGRCAVCN
jgi:hypothetical protein